MPFYDGPKKRNGIKEVADKAKEVFAKLKQKKIIIPFFGGKAIALVPVIVGALVVLVGASTIVVAATNPLKDNVHELQGEKPLHTSIAAVVTPTPAPTATHTPEPTPTINPFTPLEPDTNDERVVDLQLRLMELDYMEPDEPSDYYGSITQYAVQLFQREHGLQVDGYAGETTLTLLYSDEAKPYVVWIGQRGYDVSEYQDRLKELGYLKNKTTGLFGTDTESAVKAFQKRNKLEIDGKIGSNTREALYAENVKAARVPVATSKPSGSSGSKGSSGSSSSGSAVKPATGSDANAMIKFAQALVGSKYVRGGKGPNQFDCSGFVYYCLKNNGVNLKYMTSSGWASCGYEKITSLSKAKPGDILVYRGHVGIYLGNNKMVDASSSNGKVRIASNIHKSSYWNRNFLHIRRVY